MNETTGKAASCLAITEKKAQRPGGCAGIFFQLFDWNRRFAKKKLFSRKLLPPARAKQASKKFAGDEKMPKTKLHLIADENSGGFPNVTRNGIRGNGADMVEHKLEMQAPGLVARLMGLETLPAVHREKHRKATNFVSSKTREERFVSSHNGECIEKGNVQVESRPQKLQKTGQFERRTVTRFGTEALQIKSVLSRSKKHHHPKLTPPVKSPRLSTSRNASRTSRLIDAATRILEPGLQATNRAKCALTYSTSVSYAPSDDTLTGERMVMSADIVKEQHNNGCYDSPLGKSFMGQGSCRNCGNSLDAMDSRTVVEEPPFVCSSAPSVLVNTSSQGSERINPMPVSSSPVLGTDDLCQKNSDQPSAAAGKLDDMQVCNEPISDRSRVFPERPSQKQLRHQQCRPQKDEPFKHRIQVQNEMALSRDRATQRARLSNLQSRRSPSSANAVSGETNFVASNRSSSSRSRSRASIKTDNLMIDNERKLCSRREDSLSQGRPSMRKRRAVSVNAQVEGLGFGNAMSTRQRHIKHDLENGKEPRLNGRSRSMDHTRVKSGSAIQGQNNRVNGYNNNDVVSLTFNSQLRPKASISIGLKERINQVDKNITCHRKLVLDENDSKTTPSHLPLTGDALGMLLEQKLRELTSQEEDESTSGGAPPKRSAAVILQELISALTSAPSEQPILSVGHTFTADTSFQGRRGTKFKYSHDGDHLSPGSVLEASFSNDSCISSSMDDNSGGRLAPDSMESSYDLPKSIETDSELLDSATSVNDGRTGSNMVIDLLNHISRILQSINLAGGRLSGTKLIHAKEVILNGELLFGNASSCGSDKMKMLLICPFLLNELETLGDSMWMNLNCLLGFEESKRSDQVRRFLFDCLMECLESKYGRHCNSGFKAWRKLPKGMNADMLIQEIREEVRRWTNLVGMIPDEIIEWEMSHSLGKWTDFEVEEFETGAEIDWEILQTLVDEIVTDLRN